MDEDGYLFITGRTKDLIIRGGENIAPGEIEAVLQQHPAVEDAAVIGVPDVEWGEEVKAIVVAKPAPKRLAGRADRVRQGPARQLQGAEVLRLRRRASRATTSARSSRPTCASSTARPPARAD